MNQRLETVTRRVETSFGSLYVHVGLVLAALVGDHVWLVDQYARETPAMTP